MRGFLAPCAMLTLGAAQTAVALQFTGIHAALRLGEAWLGIAGCLLPEVRKGRRRIVRIVSEAEVARLVPRWNGRAA